MELFHLLLSDNVGRLSLLTIIVTMVVVFGALWAIFKNVPKSDK